MRHGSDLYWYVRHHDTEILVADFRGLKGQETLDAFREFARYAATHDEGSLRILTLAHGIEYTPRSMRGALELARNNRKYARKSALVGLDHLAGLVNIINRLSGRSIRTFEDEAAAKDWLVAEEG